MTITTATTATTTASTTAATATTTKNEVTMDIASFRLLLILT